MFIFMHFGIIPTIFIGFYYSDIGISKGILNIWICIFALLFYIIVLFLFSIRII